MRQGLILVCVLGLASVASGQAVTGYSGGSQYGSYYGTDPGDVVGYRFTVSSPLEVSDLGIWNADSDGLTAAHQVGIWDASQALLASASPAPGGTVVGSWTYAAITPITLSPGQTYTIGALYTATDGDSYLSGATSMTTAAEVAWVQSVYPASAGLGFVFPASNSTSYGRFGPNFLFTVVPVELQSFTVE